MLLNNQMEKNLEKKCICAYMVYELNYFPEPQKLT